MQADLAAVAKALDATQAALDRLGAAVASFGESIVKDAAKAGLKAYIDSIERDAWVDLFKKDIAANLLRPAYLVATNAYWDAVAEVQRRLEQNAELIEGYDPKRGIRVEIARRFPAGTKILVDLTVRRARARGGVPPEITVLVGGEKAIHNGGGQYRATAAGPGTVSLELR